MSKRFDFGEVLLSVGSEVLPAHPDEDSPFHIAVLGDFSGRAGRGRIDDRRAHLVDRDNFDEVLSRLRPELHLPIGGSEPLTLVFSELDDFHPDRLFQRSQLFLRLREVRRRLQDPDTFAAAAEELGIPVGPQAAPKPAAEAASAKAVAAQLVQEHPGGLLDEMVESSDASSREEGRPVRPRDALQDFVRQVTEPHLETPSHPRQAEVIGAIDRALSAQMRALLHAPAFQALEAAWRALFFLVRRVETGSQLKIYLIDIAKEDLAADLASSPDLSSTGVYKLLVEKTADGEPWSLIVGNYTFGPQPEDGEWLGRFTRIAHAAGAVFIAAASPQLLGCDSLADTPHPRDWRLSPDADSAAAWSALRGLPEASATGLALPRFLLRLPYGKNTDAIEAFDFEEMPGTPAHEDYLWGNPATACAVLLAQSFSEDGWQMHPGTHHQIDGLPLHIYKRDGDSELTPCAETLLTEAAAVRILENGLMPLATLKGSDSVQLVRFQSIAAPLRALAGRWKA